MGEPRLGRARAAGNQETRIVMVAIEAADVNTKLQIGAGDGGQCALEWVTRILV